MIMIIGGGPAGMMAAISAASTGSKVTLIEKNPSLGKKLLLTGGGHCNLTNACPPEELVGHFSGTGDFLRDAFKAFSNRELLLFFHKRGLGTKVDGSGRVLPVTDTASSVLDTLKAEIDKLRVKVILNKSVKGIFTDENAVKGIVLDDESVIEAETVIIATGGVSYRSTGSTGDGIKIAERTGHTIIPLRPGLVSLDIEGSYSKAMEGLVLEKVKLIFKAGKARFVSEEDSLLFTGRGISGPVTLSSSARVVDWLAEGKKVSVEIDIAPALSMGEAGEMLSRELSGSGGKKIKNILRGMVPVRYADTIIKITGLQPEKKASQVTAKEKELLAASFKGLRFEISRSGSFEKAQVTRGGVSVKEIDPKTMESKKIKGLYFAGEMIDVAGDCGGFNLQAAFSTGYLAGLSAALGE